MKKIILSLVLTTLFAVSAAKAQVVSESMSPARPPYPLLDVYSTDNFSYFAPTPDNLLAVVFTVRNKDPERLGRVQASCDVYYDQNWRSLFQKLGWKKDGPAPMETISGTLKNQRGGIAMWPGDNVAYLEMSTRYIPIDYVECRAGKLTLAEPDMLQRTIKSIAATFKN